MSAEKNGSLQDGKKNPPDKSGGPYALTRLNYYSYQLLYYRSAFYQNGCFVVQYFYKTALNVVKSQVIVLVF
jgi:hypothetical protein